MAKAVVEKREAWKMLKGIREGGEQPPTGLRHLYDQKKKKKTARRAVDHGGVWRKNCTKGLTKMVAKR